MEKWQVVSLLVAGLLLLVLSIFIRAHYGDRFEIRTIDLVLTVLPLLFALLVTGKIKVLDAFGIKADLSELFAEAAGETIEEQVDKKSSPGVDELVTMLEMSAKGGVGEIPALLEKKTEALLFRLGHGGYYGPAIRSYFDALYASSYFQYLIVTNSDGTLFGVYDALDLAVHFRTANNPDNAYDNLATWLNGAGEADRKNLAQLPGFIDVNKAIERNLSKRESLKRMDDLRADSLPVIDSKGFFVGTVNRSQLTASLILDVVNRLEGAKGD